MKYLPERGIFFIHIPKCAGTSVHAALDLEEASYDGFAEDLGVDVPLAMRLALSRRPEASQEEREAAYSHPTLGNVHPLHIPLTYLRSDMPRTWQALSTAPCSFGLIRAPRERFISALMQRLREFGGAGPIRVDDPLVKQEAVRVSNWLNGNRVFCDAEYAHFSRQIDFVDLEGTRVIKGVFPVDRTDALSKWLRDETGLVVEIPQIHVRRQPKSWGRAIQPVARFAGRRLMPQALKRAMHPLWMNSGVFSDAAKGYDAVDLGGDVDRFIADFYAEDAALLEEAKSNAERVMAGIKVGLGHGEN